MVSDEAIVSVESVVYRRRNRYIVPASSEAEGFLRKKHLA